MHSYCCPLRSMPDRNSRKERLEESLHLDSHFIAEQKFASSSPELRDVSSGVFFETRKAPNILLFFSVLVPSLLEEQHNPEKLKGETFITDRDPSPCGVHVRIPLNSFSWVPLISTKHITQSYFGSQFVHKGKWHPLENPSQLWVSMGFSFLSFQNSFYSNFIGLQIIHFPALKFYQDLQCKAALPMKWTNYLYLFIFSFSNEKATVPYLFSSLALGAKNK